MDGGCKWRSGLGWVVGSGGVRVGVVVIRNVTLAKVRVGCHCSAIFQIVDLRNSGPADPRTCGIADLRNWYSIR